MKKLHQGFGLIELMVSIVLLVVILLGIYRFWIKGVETMSDTVKISVLKRSAQVAFDTVLNDLKLIGYNPLGKLDPNNCTVSGEDPCALVHRRPFGIVNSSPNDITYSFYNPDSDDDYCDPNCCCCTDPFCTRTRYWVQNLTFTRKYWNTSSTSQEDVILLNNACINFSLINVPPTAIRFILAAAPDQHPAIDTFTPLNTDCSIPQPPPGEQQKFVRFEKMVKLINLH